MTTRVGLRVGTEFLTPLVFPNVLFIDCRGLSATLKKSCEIRHNIGILLRHLEFASTFTCSIASFIMASLAPLRHTSRRMKMRLRTTNTSRFASRAQRRRPVTDSRRHVLLSRYTTKVVQSSGLSQPPGVRRALLCLTIGPAHRQAIDDTTRPSTSISPPSPSPHSIALSYRLAASSMTVRSSLAGWHIAMRPKTPRCGCPK
jgi:hypothetical protein